MKNKRRWTWKRKHVRKHSFVTFRHDDRAPKSYHRKVVLLPNRRNHRKIEQEILKSTNYDDIEIPLDINNAKTWWYYF